MVGCKTHSQTVRFQSLSIQDGLSQSAINCITQDSLGYIWIGTQDGLNRFDGINFKVYKHQLNNKNCLTNSYVTDLVIDKSGNFWIGTQSGGITFFNPRSNQFSSLKAIPKVVNATINDLEIIGNTLFIATSKNGFYCYDILTKEVETLNTSTGFESNKIAKINKVDNVLWLGTEDQGLIVFDPKTKLHTHFAVSEKNNTIQNNSITIAHKLSDSTILLGTSDKSELVNTTKIIPTFREALYGEFRNKNIGSISCILQINDTTHWIGTSGEGIYRMTYTKGKYLLSNYKDNELYKYSVTSNVIIDIFQDLSGTIWIGTQDGISFFDPKKQGFQSYNYEPGSEQSIMDKTVWSLYHEDSLTFVGTLKGITCINNRHNTFHQFYFHSDNLNKPNNHSIFAMQKGPNGMYWCCTSSGLYNLSFSEDLSKYEYTKVRFRDSVNEWDDDLCYSLTFDGEEYVYVAAKEGLSRLSLKDNSYHFFKNDPSNSNSISAEPCRSCHIDSKGDIWLAFIGDGIAKLDISKGILDPKFNYFKTDPANPNSLSNNTVLDIIELPKGTLWFGTYGGGLNKYEIANNSFTVFAEEDGLANNAINALASTKDRKHIWISTNYGLSSFNIKTNTFKNYHESDGLQSNEFNSGASYSDDNGQLFFGGIDGFNSFYPDDIHSNPIEPLVVITDILIANKPFVQEYPELGNISYLSEITLGYKQNNLTFKFAAMHYTYPKGNHYKVILKGVDEDIRFLNDLQQINYSNLASGDYEFKIWAANSDGIWSMQPTIIKIHIESPFWRSWWFITILVIFLAIIVYISYILRIKSIKSQKERLAFLVEKRTKTITYQKEQIEKQKLELEIEKEKAEKLLLNILPSETAEELKNKGKTRPRYYRMVTVLFTDIKGFTQIAEDYKPTNLVKRLDNLFREIDKIIEKHQIEKIKTIGDAYMAAGGVPLRDKENPINCVLASLEIQAFMLKEEKRNKDEEPWQMRIGLHTGDIIAGVIGSKRIAYDIWGNTVNVANRMEMSGEPGKVNISGITYEYIKPYFDCTYRGKVAAKNKGEIDMYFVEGIKPHLSKGSQGKVPNIKFKEYVNLHIYSSINYRKAERHIMKILKAELSPNLHYHGIHHTCDVVEAVERLAILEGVLDEDIFVLKSAATYHDAGFVKEYDKNEPIGAQMASDILPLYGYTQDQVAVVHDLIYATIIPHDPSTRLQEIICDADLDYLGRDDFFTISDTLRRELRDHGKINSDRVWDEIQVKFLTMHRYFTNSAKKLRETKKMEHLEVIKQRLIEDNYKD
ncbi:MAG: class 3 adenylate cyclase/ligand-binding sensor domain-containing protein [Parvicella sp.]